jgi:hypothetical protein
MDPSIYGCRYGEWSLALGVIVLAIAGAWTAHASILRGLADWWVISDPLDRADGIVVLGGRMDVRPSLQRTSTSAGLHLGF